MNVIKGLDRIAFVIAIIAILPGFILGANITNKALKSVTMEYKAKYKAWEKKFGEEYKKYTDLVKKEKDREWREYGGARSAPISEWLRAQGIEPPEPPREEYNYPPGWQCILARLLSASLSFVVVLYALRGMTRGTRWLAVWIIDGFRDEKKGNDKHTGNEANNQNCVSNGT